MIHHTCRHSTNEFKDHAFLGRSDGQPTVVGTDYTGRYRCAECKRKVKMPDGSIRGPVGDGGLTIEPPYPSGWC